MSTGPGARSCLEVYMSGAIATRRDLADLLSKTAELANLLDTLGDSFAEAVDFIRSKLPRFDEENDAHTTLNQIDFGGLNEKLADVEQQLSSLPPNENVTQAQVDLFLLLRRWWNKQMLSPRLVEVRATASINLVGLPEDVEPLRMRVVRAAELTLAHALGSRTKPSNGEAWHGKVAVINQNVFDLGPFSRWRCVFTALSDDELKTALTAAGAIIASEDDIRSFMNALHETATEPEQDEEEEDSV